MGHTPPSPAPSVIGLCLYWDRCHVCRDGWPLLSDHAGPTWLLPPKAKCVQVTGLHTSQRAGFHASTNGRAAGASADVLMACWGRPEPSPRGQKRAQSPPRCIGAWFLGAPALLPATLGV